MFINKKKNGISTAKMVVIEYLASDWNPLINTEFPTCGETKILYLQTQIEISICLLNHL